MEQHRAEPVSTKATVIGGIMSIAIFFTGIIVSGWFRAINGVPSAEVAYIISAIAAGTLGYATFLLANDNGRA
jgi:phosphate/sulfate permease